MCLWATAVLWLAGWPGTGAQVQGTGQVQPLTDLDVIGSRVVTAARAQIGVCVRYNGAYVPLAYPMGDMAPDRGVCTDVVVRALRRGVGLDLQQRAHEDMVALQGLSEFASVESDEAGCKH